MRVWAIFLKTSEMLKGATPGCLEISFKGYKKLLRNPNSGHRNTYGDGGVQWPRCGQCSHTAEHYRSPLVALTIAALKYLSG
jgi:hypothetical protein